MAITWDAGSGGFNFYLNGELKTGPVETGGLVSPITPGGILMFGQEPDAYGDMSGGFSFDAGQAFSGALDEVRFFKKALTAAEVAADMETPYTDAYGTDHDIILALTFDEPYYLDNNNMTRVKAHGTGGFPDLYAGNPDAGWSEASIPVLGPGVTYAMGADMIALVEPVVGATLEITLLASSTATSFTMTSTPACCSAERNGDVVTLTVTDASAVDGGSFTYEATDGTTTGSATVQIVASVAPTQIDASCATDIALGEFDPDYMFTLYGFSDVGATTAVEFVTVPEYGTLY
jgi:hypothetical protein